MKRIGGFRRKSRQKLSKPLKMKGKLHITKFLQTFEEGEKVILKAYPSHHGGMFPLKFYGSIGKIVGKQGSCYKVNVKEGKKNKQLVVHPVHMERV